MIYTAIKEICKEKNVSVAEIEKKAGLSNGLISKWNESSPTIENLEAVANALGIKVQTILKRRNTEE